MNWVNKNNKILEMIVTERERFDMLIDTVWPLSEKEDSSNKQVGLTISAEAKQYEKSVAYSSQRKHFRETVQVSTIHRL